MLKPCKVTYGGKEYSIEDYLGILHDGLLDQMVKDGIIDDSKFTPMLKTVEKTEPETPLEKFEYQKKQISKNGKTELEIKKEIFAKAKEMAAAIRALKIDGKGKAFDATLGLPVAVWNGAIETVATAIEAGVAVADAIKRGLNYIQKNNRGQWNKKAYNDRVINELGLRGIEVNGEDLIVQPLEDKATVELVNGFYSPLEKGIAEAKTDKATGKGWMKVLSGVTEADELNYTGVKDFLESNADRPISRKELLDYMKDNRIEVVEVVLGGKQGLTRAETIQFNKIDKEIDVLEKERTRLARESYDKNQSPERQPEYQEVTAKIKALMVDWGRLRDKAQDRSLDTKFNQYQLEGEKENYKEVLVTLPSKNVFDKNKVEIKKNYQSATQGTFDVYYNGELLANGYDLFSAGTSQYGQKTDEQLNLFAKNLYEKGDKYNKIENKQGNFKSSHFDEPNILVHLRMNTRTDSEGNKVLFIEEVQSDWGQKGKKEGFGIDDTKYKKRLNEINLELDAISERVGNKADQNKELLNDITTLKTEDFNAIAEKKYPDVYKDLTNESILIKEKKDLENKLFQFKNIPTAPFVTDTNAWTKLGLKTALKEAVAQGADKLAWTTGEQQNDRYDLSKSVKRVDFIKVGADRYKYEALDLNSKRIAFDDNGTTSLKDIESMFGKDIAEKVKADKKGDLRLEGDGLKVGGKGMKGFYGSPTDGSLGIVGGVAEKLFGQKLGTIEINKGTDDFTKDEALKLLKQGEKIYTYNRGTMYRLYDESDINEATNYFSKKGEAKSTQYSIDITPELKEAVKEGIPLFKNDLVQAKERLKVASAKLDAVNRNFGIANDPEQIAKVKFEYYKALVDVAKAYIKTGIDNVKDFAKEIGEKVEDVIDAWNEANGGKKKTVEDFKVESEPKQPKQKPIKDGDDFDEDELNVMGITKKEAKRIREELGEEQYQYQRKSRIALEAEADRKIADGFSVPNLIKRINKDPKASDVEIELLRRYFTSLTARINTKPTPALLQERKDLMSALDLLKTSAGRTVQAFDGLIAVEDNLASFLEEESKYADLSENEIETLAKKYKEASEALEKLKLLTEKAEDEALNKKLQSELNKQQRASKPRGVIKEDFKAERKKYVEDFRAELKRIRSTPNAVILPYTRELIALAPFVKRMTESYVKEGVFELKDIVKRIQDEFKEDMPELTEGDIKDILAGQYPNPRKTKNAKLAQVRDLEIQARLERRIEELEAGIIKTKSPVERKVKSDKVDALEKEIKLIKQRNPELTYPSKLEGRKTWYKNRIAELKEDIKKGDYDNIVAPVSFILDDEALKLKDEYIKFRDETTIRRENKEAEAMGTLEKNLKRLRELAEIKRVVQTSIDVSIPLRQGVSVMLNPRTTKIGVEGYGKMLNTMFSEKKYNRLMYDIENNPEFLRSKDDGIVYTDLGSNNIELRDESHPVKGFIQKIPILGKGIKISARAAAAWTNYARFELYQRQVRLLKAQGKTRENAKEAYEQAAARVMTDTGRGKLPILSDKQPSQEGTAIKQVLGTVFYGARLYSSTFRKLNPFYYFNPRVDKTVRLEAFKDMAGYVASQIIVTTAVAAALGATVSLDYDEPDFMKLRIGKRVIDLTAGQGVYIRTFLRLVHAAYNRFDPTVSEKDANEYAEFAKASVSTFWRNKLAPNTSYMLNAFSGKNGIGEKFDPYEIIKIYPMYTDDIINAFKEGSPLDALFILPVGISGLGYQEYSKDIRRARVSNYIKDPKIKSFFEKKKINITGQINQEIYDAETGDQVKMTKERSDKYEKSWSEYIIDRVKSEIPKLEKLSEEELDKEIIKIKTNATEFAKENVTGIDPKILTIESDNEIYKLTPNQVKERKDIVMEYIKDYGKDIYDAQVESAIEIGKSIGEAKIIADKKVKSSANSYSKSIMLEKYTDQDGNIKIPLKE
jgi:hypothetical protein